MHTFATIPEGFHSTLSTLHCVVQFVRRRPERTKLNALLSDKKLTQTAAVAGQHVGSILHGHGEVVKCGPSEPRGRL